MPMYLLRFLCCYLFGALVFANPIYKCRSATGATSYQYSPCPKEANAIPLADPPVSVIEQGPQQRKMTEAYQQDLQHWSKQYQRELVAAQKAKQKAGEAEYRDYLRRQKKCQALHRKKNSLSMQLVQARSVKRTERLKRLLVEVGQYMQDERCIS